MPSATRLAMRLATRAAGYHPAGRNSMTKSEIIELTLSQISYKQNPPPAEIADSVGIEGYGDFVTATLVELLPSGNIETCEDFKELGVERCHTCHTYYPHFDMKLVTQKDGSKAWICCSLRTALLETGRSRHEGEKS